MEQLKKLELDDLIVKYSSQILRLTAFNVEINIAIILREYYIIWQILSHKRFSNNKVNYFSKVSLCYQANGDVPHY